MTDNHGKKTEYLGKTDVYSLTVDQAITATNGVTAAAGGFTATTGNITATAGNIVATAGDISATSGRLTISGALADGLRMTGGGNVTQTGAITNTVTHPGSLVGTVQTVSASVSAHTSATFTMNHNGLSATDHFLFSVMYEGASQLSVTANPGAGSVDFHIHNCGLVALNEPITIHFLIIKAS